MGSEPRTARDDLFALATAVFEFDAVAALRAIVEREDDSRARGCEKTVWRDNAGREALLTIERAQAAFREQKERALAAGRQTWGLAPRRRPAGTMETKANGE